MGPFSPFCNDLVGKNLGVGQSDLSDGKGVGDVRLAMSAVPSTR